VLAYRIKERSSLRPMSRPACRSGQDPTRISEHTSSRERITGSPGSIFVESTATRRMGHGGGESEDGKAGEVRRGRSVQRLARGGRDSPARSCVAPGSASYGVRAVWGECDVSRVFPGTGRRSQATGSPMLTR